MDQDGSRDAKAPISRDRTARSGNRADLAALSARARADLASLSYPTTGWVTRSTTRSGMPVHAVVIVGGGQSGLAIAAALRRDGVEDVVILDKSPAGREGVWDDFARMEELRTPKALNGMEFGCPSLSVQAWYSETYGADAWAALDRIPRLDWADYLRWYQATLEIKIENDTLVTDIRAATGEPGLLEVVAQAGARTVLWTARTVVIASGFDGAGAWRVPALVSDSLPRDRYSHSNGPVDFARLRGARIAILGNGASAFDNANAALAAGAARVDLCFRRDRLPRFNPHRYLETAGTMTHFSRLDPAIRWRVARYMRLVDQPPPPRGFRTALAHPDFHLHPACPWLSVALQGTEVAVETPQGRLLCDHLLCATGLVVDLAARPELSSLASQIALWRDRYQPEPDEADERLGAYPFVAPDFSFDPRDEASAWVSRVFCFNFASAVSHGPHMTSISGHRHALPQLVRGVTGRLFEQQAGSFLGRFIDYADPDLDVPLDFELTHAAPFTSGQK